MAAGIKLKKENFVERAYKIHGKKEDGTYKFNYLKFIYTNNKTPGIITCLICDISHDFLARAGNHLNGSGCPGN